jgi:hypothetical protein
MNLLYPVQKYSITNTAIIDNTWIQLAVAKIPECGKSQKLDLDIYLRNLVFINKAFVSNTT